MRGIRPKAEGLSGVVGNRVVSLIERGTAIPVSATHSRFTNEGPYETLQAPVS
jgi:hypothetical protein